MRLAIIGHLGIDFVRHDRDIGEFLESLHEFVDFSLRCHAACGIGRRIDDQQPGFRRDQGQCFLRRKGEAVFLAHRNRNGPCAGKLDHRAINRKTGIGIENICTGFAKQQDCHEHGDLASRHDHHKFGRDLDIEAFVQIGCDRFAQRENAGCRRVPVMAVAQCLYGGLDDIFRRPEIRLADAEIDDVLALTLQFGGPGENGEGVFFANAREGFNDVQHG